MVKIIYVIIAGVIVAIIIFGLWYAVSTGGADASQTTKAENGQASVHISHPKPEHDFKFECQAGGAKPKLLPVERVDYLESATADLTKLETKQCDPPQPGCDHTVWRVHVTRISKIVIGTDERTETEKRDGPYDLGTLDCGCVCPTKTTLLNLKWKDFEMKAYPGGELATYYNVRFNLSNAATGKELATWTAWVRTPGGHTHYGHLGSKLIEIDLERCSPEPKLVECAQRETDRESARPPAAAPVG